RLDRGAAGVRDRGRGDRSHPADRDGDAVPGAGRLLGGHQLGDRGAAGPAEPLGAPPDVRGWARVTRYIRHAAAFCALLLVALLVNAARVQLLRAESYRDNPANRRDTIARYHQPRGDILVAGRPVTGSRDTREHLRYERTYRDGPLYAPVTGFASQEYGTTLLEHTEDAVLSGTDPVLA